MKREEYRLYLDLMNLLLKYGEGTFINVLSAIRSGEKFELDRIAEELKGVVTHTGEDIEVKPNYTTVQDWIDGLRNSEDVIDRRVAETTSRVLAGELLAGAKIREFCQAIRLEPKTRSRGAIVMGILQKFGRMSPTEKETALNMLLTVDSGKSSLQGWADIIIKAN